MISKELLIQQNNELLKSYFKILKELSQYSINTESFNEEKLEYLNNQKYILKELLLTNNQLLKTYE